MNKKIFLPLILILLFPLPSFAALVCVGNSTTITGIVCNVGNVISAVAIIIIVVFWIITGLLFLLARGDPSGLGKAKVAFFAAIGGTAIAILAATAKALIEMALTSGT
jgi:hypothetical protein